MIKEIIFILILFVVILIAVAASGPSTILKAESYTALSPAKKKKNARVRFSPEKKERTYNVKTGQITGDSIVPVEESEDIELNE